MNFNENWRFRLEEAENLADARHPQYDDSSWRVLNLPHDWSIELDFNPDSPATHEGGFLDGGIGWYRKTFTIPEEMKGKRIFIEFEGVYMNSTTYVNGELIGTYPYGYNAFSYDITEKLNFDGENVIAVKVNNTQPSSRWYSGSGIYRNVYLKAKHPIHVARYGTFVTTPELERAYAEGRADVNIKTKVKNTTAEIVDIQVRSTILNKEGEAITTTLSSKQPCTPGTTAHFEEQTVIENPILWDLEQPYRYKLVTEVLVENEVVDTYETRFGIRYFEFDNNEGFSLNGRYMKLHGVCMHHDLGALGAAVNKRAVERQMQIMKEMGVNAIRVSHNPASPELLEACNDLGLLVIDEAFDCWSISKKTYDYGRFFNEWAEHDIKEMVDRGKNEPCIIMWSIGNEIYDTTNPNGVEIARNLCRWVKEIDTTRPTTIGEDKTRGDKVNVTEINPYIKEIFDIVDVVGFNYSENNYAGYHKLYPEWKMYGAETSSATRSRGVYTHPYEYNMSTTYDDLQQSSYDNDYVAWGRTAEEAWKYDRDLKHLAGQFIWTGFDYIGEPTPYYNTFPAKSSYFGAVDTAGFPKDIFYYYQSQWKKEPMVHLLPHWNWEEGEMVRVLAYTNAHSVELFLNRESIGERNYEVKKTSWGAPYKETKDGKTYLEWAVPFQPGKLEAVAKDESGEVVARDEVITAGAPAAIRLTADRRVIKADGTDLSFVIVDIVDKDGNIVPNADNLVEFAVSGDGALVGVDNGNASSIERFKDHKRKAFNGKALAILQATKLSGEINLTATAEGLASDSIQVFTASTVEREEQAVVGVEPVVASSELPTEVNVYYGDEATATKTVKWFDNKEGEIVPDGVRVLAISTEQGYVLEVADRNPKLIAANITVDTTALVEDDLIELSVTGRFENDTVTELAEAEIVYHVTGDNIKVKGNKLYAYNEGEAKVSATVTYRETTIQTPEVAFTITKNPVEKVIQRLESITLITEQGQEPALPEMVTAHFNTGFPREVAVQWEPIKKDQYDQLGELTVEGKVDDTDLPAVAKVIVRGPVAVEQISMAVLKNQLPELPNTVTVYYNDGTEKSFAVEWQDFDRDKVDIVGVFAVEGEVKDVGFKTRATIRVTEKIGGRHNIGRAKNGYDYPRADASFTSGDRIEAIHDDVISYDSAPHNRWTNWHPEPRPSDWVSITFGDYEPEEYYVDEIEIHWYEDHGISYPASFTIEYNQNGEWIEVTNLNSDPAEPALRQANVYTFDLVKTSAIRVNMNGQPGKAIGITEIKVFSKWPAVYHEPKVKDIKLAGESILDRFTRLGDTFEYNVELTSEEPVPTIVATGEDNTAITIVPALSAPGTTKLIAKSENGKKSAIYHIHFHIKQ